MLFGQSLFVFSSRRRDTRFDCDWSSDVCSSDLPRETRAILEGIEDGPSLEAYVGRGGYAALVRAALANDPAALPAMLRVPGPRGMGGAGFPAGAKWDAVRLAEGSPKFVVVNADEGEPGAFKDRVLLERLPHRVLEGAFLAAFAVGASTVYFYVRDE